MNALQAIRTHRERRISRSLSMLAVAWLGAVAQPCLAAVETDDQCPHCPVQMSELGIPDGCTYLDAPDSDGRVAGKGVTDDAPDENPTAIAPLPRELRSQILTFATGPPAHEAVDFPSPRLNTIYCVYLK